eukprot:2116099-Alexandrium_andersonii.AAC.1
MVQCAPNAAVFGVPLSLSATLRRRSALSSFARKHLAAPRSDQARQHKAPNAVRERLEPLEGVLGGLKLREARIAPLLLSH